MDQMRFVKHEWRVGVAAAIVALGAGRVEAQRAGESGGAIDAKSGRFLTEFTGVPARAPDTLAVSEARVFAALPAVFTTLAVPLTVVDSAAKAMGAVRVLVRRPIGGQRLSLLLECGTGNYGPNAERYSVQLTLVARARAIDSTHTEVLTMVRGDAAPNGLSTSVSCASSGRLEERFAELLKKEVAR
jgi:hypothetical protein